MAELINPFNREKLANHRVSPVSFLKISSGAYPIKDRFYKKDTDEEAIFKLRLVNDKTNTFVEYCFLDPSVRNNKEYIEGDLRYILKNDIYYFINPSNKNIPQPKEYKKCLKDIIPNNFLLTTYTFGNKKILDTNLFYNLNFSKNDTDREYQEKINKREMYLNKITKALENFDNLIIY